MRNHLLLPVITICILFTVSTSAFALVSPTVSSPVDIAPFARVVTWVGPVIRYTGVNAQKSRTLEPKNGIITVNAEPGSKSLNFGLVWDELRTPDVVTITFADQASVPDPKNVQVQSGTSSCQDDWHALKSSEGFSVSVKGRKWTCRLPETKNGIYQLRFTLKNKTVARIESITVQSDAKWREARFRASFATNVEQPVSIEAFNAHVIKTDPVQGENAVEVIAVASDAPSDSNDRAIFTVRAGDKSFSFLMNDLDADGAILVKPFGATVTRPGAQAPAAAGKTIIERVLDMPEQTFDGALKNVPSKQRNKLLALAPSLNNRKYAVRPNGDLFARDEEDMVYRTATGDTPDFERREPQHVEDGCYPVLYADWQDQGLNWQQGYVVSTPDNQFDDPNSSTTMVTRVSADNPGQAPIIAKLWLCLEGEDHKRVGPQVKDGAIHENDHLRALLTADGWAAEPKDSLLLFTVIVPPGESRSVELEIPYPGTKTLPARIGFDEARKETIGYWKSKLTGGSDFSVPDERVNALWKSLLIHQYTWGGYDSVNGCIPNVAAFMYGPVGNESSQMAKALDFYGHARMAGDYFDPMWHRQGDENLPAMATNGRGCMPGWWNGYVFNTGFELWNICNHYRLTRDRIWFDRALPNLIKACNWIIEQRKTTIGWELDGRPTLHSGFFPMCGLEDEGAFFYWTMTNAYLYCGVKSLADTLTEIGHPDAQRLRQEAAAYLRDIHRGLAEATVRCPVVKLQDGSYVPCIPKHLYRRGRSEGFYEAELGAIHTLTTGVYGPRDPQVDWMLNFLEDEVFLTEVPGQDSIISFKNLRQDWFNLGGYGKQQPYLLHQQIAYLRRDEPKLFVRSFWNQLVAQAFLDVNAFPEHICWKGAADCKTYEEAMWLQQFRSMLVFDEDGELRLCAATPREWLEQGKTISVKNAPSFFGTISYEISSDVDHGKITARVEFRQQKAPSRLTIRFRHPAELKIKSVTVNGEPWSQFDPEKETIDIPTKGKPVEVVAHY